jgi:hypothetical protein
MERRIFVPVSDVLQGLHDEAPTDDFTLSWLMASLNERSFGLIILLLAVAAATPGLSFVAGLLLVIPSFQMIAGQSAPVFPQRIATRPVPTRHLAVLVRRAVPLLRYTEKAMRPRWPTSLVATKRIVGAVVMMLSATLILTPIPLSNVIPALVIALISLAYLEEDGLLLAIALVTGCIVLALEVGAVWGTILGVQWATVFW